MPPPPAPASVPSPGGAVGSGSNVGSGVGAGVGSGVGPGDGAGVGGSVGGNVGGSVGSGGGGSSVILSSGLITVVVPPVYVSTVVPGESSFGMYFDVSIIITEMLFPTLSKLNVKTSSPSVRESSAAVNVTLSVPLLTMKLPYALDAPTSTNDNIVKGITVPFAMLVVVKVIVNDCPSLTDAVDLDNE
jgi:hypothetical protein